MASTFSTNLKIELQTTGENSGTWGTITNTNLGTALEQAIVGYGNPSYASDANLTLTYTDTNAAQTARALVLNVTSAVSLTGTRELVVPTIQKQYIVQNNTTGSQSITVKTSGGTGVTVPNGRKAHLYVNGTDVIYMDDYVDINGGAIDGTPIGANSASTGAFTTLAASGNVTLSGGTANGVLYLNGSKVATSGSVFAFNGTNVSLGTTSSTNKLLIDTAVGNAGNIQLPRGGYIGFSNAADNANSEYIFANGGNLEFGTNATTKATLDTSGNLGLGVTPSAWAGRAFQIGNASNSGWASIGYDANGKGFFSTSAYNNTGSSWTYTATGFAATLYSADAGSHKWFNAPSGTAGNAISFTQAMTLDTSGNLGIGTSSPAARIHVDSGSTGLMALLNSTNANGGYITGQSSGSAVWDLGTAKQVLNVGGSSDVGLNTRSGFLVFGTANTERMRLDSSGNLGIGTASPTSKLDLVGIMQWQATAGTVLGKLTYSGGEPVVLANTGLGLQFFTNNAFAAKIDTSGNLGLGVTPSAWGSIFKAAQIGTGGSVFGRASGNQDVCQVGANVFWDGSNWKYIASLAATRYEQASGTHVWSYAGSGTAGNTITFTEAMTLNASGNLGVGTTSPFSTLHIRKDSAATQFAIDTTTGGNSYGGVIASLGSADTGLVFSTKFNSTVTERARITSGGQLVVAATSGPSGSSIAAAGIIDSVSATSPAYRLLTDNTTLIGGFGSGNWAFGDGTTNVAAYAGTSKALLFGAGGSERARIDSSGNLGVGTTSPSSFGKLAVVGTSTGVLCAVRDEGTPSGNTFVVSSNANGTGIAVNSSGNVLFGKNISVGSATPTTSGTGITFPATQSASSDANTLDDYEEGTWSPVLSDGTNTVGLGTGWYTKIGRLIKLNVNAYNVSTSGLSTGVQLKITGMPFAVDGNKPIYQNAALAQTTPLVTLLAESNGATEVYLWEDGNAVDYNQFYLSDWGSPANITIRTYIMYEV